MDSTPSRKQIIEEILTKEGWETANAEIARVARTRYEVDLDSRYVSSVKQQLKKKQTPKRPADPTPKKKRAPARKPVPKKIEAPPEAKRSSRQKSAVTLDDVKEVEQALATSGLELEPVLAFVRGLNQPLQNVQEVLEWLYQRQ